MARAWALPWVPTPICRIEVVTAAISPSLSATNFLGISLLQLVHDAVFWDVMNSCASVDERIHSSSSNCFEDEQEATLFRQVSRRPLERDNVGPSETSASSAWHLRRR